MTEVVQWLTYEDFKGMKKKLKPKKTTLEHSEAKSWHTESFSVEIGQLILTLKSRNPSPSEAKPC